MGALKDLKNKIWSAGMAEVEQRIQLLQKELDDVNEAAGAETKSTAGDKHETARAMMHIERENLSRQLVELMKLRTELGLINSAEKCLKGGRGALIRTDKGLLFLATALGKLETDGQTCVVISVQSPVGQIMSGAAVGESVSFRTTEYRVLEIA